jgi:hypothetical protein
MNIEIIDKTTNKKLNKDEVEDLLIIAFEDDEYKVILK